MNRAATGTCDGYPGSSSPGSDGLCRPEGNPRLGYQEQAVRDIFAPMKREAQGLGRQLVDLEAELDRAFRSGDITVAELARLTGEISAIDGRLRSTHLAAHIKTKAILTPEQVARYDQLRGYTATGTVPPAGGEIHDGGTHGGAQHSGDHGGH